MNESDTKPAYEQQFEPLLSDAAEPGPPGKKPRRSKRERAPRRSLKERWQAFVAARTDTPERAKKFKRTGIILAAVLVLGAGIGAYLALRPYPQPDYEDDPLDELFNYTLFQDEFNKLPIEERIELVGSLVKRMESMGSSDGTLLAAFAAGISGAAREQLEENAAKMMLDFMDYHATNYAIVDDPAQQEENIKNTIVDFIRMANTFDGQPTKRSDEELLARAKRDAQRDQEQFRDPNRGPSVKGVARFTNIMDNRVGAQGTPHQRARITRMMRDMTRYLRGEDLATGQPKPGG